MKSIDSIQPHHFKVSSSPGHPFSQSPYPDLRQDPFFVGRSQELRQITNNILQNRHTLISGDRGTGKTRLMQEVIALLSGNVRRIDVPTAKLPPDKYAFIFIESPAPLSKLIKRLSHELLEIDQLKAVHAMKENDLADAVIKAISASDRKHILFIDNLETVTPSHRAILESLLNVGVFCGASQSIKQQPILKKIFDSFTPVPVHSLSTDDAGRLIDYFVEQYKIRTLDRHLFTNQISKASQGNPFQMRTFLHAAATRGFLNSADIREIVYSANDRDYFNMGPLYALGLAIFSLSKILSIGASNKEFYILMSSLGFLAYLVFRIFRSFFTLKPRRNDAR